MKLGAEPKKVVVLVGLLVVAVVVFFMNSGPSGETTYTPPASAAPTATGPAGPGLAELPATQNNTTAARQQRGRTSNEFRPSVRPRRGEQRPDPMTIDPTLRLDLLAKLQQVDVAGPHRSIFDFTQPPPPPAAPVKAAAKPPVPSPIVPVRPDEPPPSAANVVPPKPQAPPIPLKFYGYVTPSGSAKRAFFMEGEDIHVVHEGDMVKRRYKIIRIGINSVTVEDTQFGSQQTLPLEEQQG